MKKYLCVLLFLFGIKAIAVQAKLIDYLPKNDSLYCAYEEVNHFCQEMLDRRNLLLLNVPDSALILTDTSIIIENFQKSPSDIIYFVEIFTKSGNFRLKHKEESLLIERFEDCSMDIDHNPHQDFSIDCISTYIKNSFLKDINAVKEWSRNSHTSTTSPIYSVGTLIRDSHLIPFI